MTLPNTTNTLDPLAQGLDVQIGTTYFRLVQGPQMSLQVRTAPPTNNTPETALNPEDFVRDEGERIFSQVDFSGGDGIEYFHRGNRENEETRFWRSEGVELVDRRGEPAVLVSAHDAELIVNETSATPDNWSNQLVYAYGKAFFPSSDDVVVVTDPNGATPTSSKEDVDTGTIDTVRSLTTVNGTLYAALRAPGIWTRDSAGTWTSYNTLVCDYIWGLKGRIVAANNTGDLFEVTASGAPPTATISLGANANFISACDAGEVILVGTDNGYIYSLQNNAGTLVNVGRTPFVGEQVVALASSHGGVVGIGTVDINDPTVGRFYVAKVANNIVVDVQLLREFEFENWSIRVTSSRARLWFAYKKVDVEKEFRIYEYRLESKALFLRIEHAPTFSTNNLRGILEISGQLFWVSHVCDLYRQHPTDRRAQSWLITALADHFDAREKNIVGARLYCHTVPTNTDVKLYLSTDPAALTGPEHASWQLALTRTAVNDDEVLVTGISGRWVAAKVELNSTSATATAELRGFAVRSLIAEPSVELQLPIECSDTLYKPGRMPLRSRRRGQEIYEHLQTLEGQQATITLLATGEQWQGNILEVSTRRPVVSARGVEQLASVVRFRGKRL